MATFWTENTGVTLTVLEERIPITYDLPIKNELLPLIDNDITIELVSGNIPAGLFLVDHTLTGTPLEVKQDTVYTFVLRASQYGHIDERTYKINVTGSDDPVWQTPEGLLPVGNNDTFYILDSEIIDFQLVAYDPDISAGDVLEYFIQEGDGALPPGTNLTKDGRLVGIVDPILAIEKSFGSGVYDANRFSTFPYDYAVRPDNGYDSFFYDVVTFDKSIPSKSPKKLNRYYEFYVSVSDSLAVTKRKFIIYVVGDDFLRADNTIMKVSNGVFTADNTYVRTPIWLTPRNFGVRRANNYIILFLEVIDPATLVGEIVYSLEEYNDDNSLSELPPGMSLNSNSGMISGKVPYQPAITKKYKFTIKASRIVPDLDEIVYKNKTFELSVIGEIDSVITWTTAADLGIIKSNYLSTIAIKATTTVPNANLIYSLVEGKLPPGLSLSFAGEIIGKVNSFGDENLSGLTTFDFTNTTTFDKNTTTFDRVFYFTVKVQDHYGFSAITRSFKIQVSDPEAITYSNIFVKPFFKEESRIEFNNIINDNILFPYDFIYRPNDPNFGIQRTMKMLIYAGIETKTVDYYVAATATNHKRKKYKLGQIETAVAKTPGTNNIVYEVVYINVVDPAENGNGETRKSISISNKELRTIDSARYTLENNSVENTDPNGIIISMRRTGDVNLYFYPNFTVGTRNNGDIIVNFRPVNVGNRNSFDYTVNTMINGSTEPYRFRPNPENTVKTDATGINVDEKNKTKKYISNIYHMRNNIKEIGETEIDFLPLWMRSSQTGTIGYLGYVKAVPLCYCKPGKSKEILSQLNNYNINFNNFIFDIDRYVIDSTSGNSNEQYIVFHNYDYNV